jgi:hypothetical protein
MAIFTHFNTTFRFTTFVAVTASSALTTNLRAELVTGLGWTEPSANRFKSPPDASGRFLEIIVSEPSAVRWQWQVLDDTGATVATREVLLSGAGETIRYYSGPYHVWVEVDKGASNDESLGAGLLDLSPESQTVHPRYTWARGHRTSAGTADGNGDTASEFFTFNISAYGVLRRLLAYRNQATTEAQMVTFSGALNIHMPAELIAQTSLSVVSLIGRLFQAIKTTSGVDNTVTVVIGSAGETGTFRVVGTNPDGALTIAFRTA